MNNGNMIMNLAAVSSKVVDSRSNGVNSKAKGDEQFKEVLKGVNGERNEYSAASASSTKESKNKKLVSSPKDHQKVKTLDGQRERFVDTNNKDVTEQMKSLEKQTVEKLAKMLDVSEEEINDLLSQLGLNSVLQLVQPENLQAFMQKVMEVENPVDLLNYSDIPAMMKDIKQLVESTMEQIASQYEEISIEMDSHSEVNDPNVQAQSSKDNQASINPTQENNTQQNATMNENKEEFPTIEIINHEEMDGSEEEGQQEEEGAVDVKQNPNKSLEIATANETGLVEENIIIEKQISDISVPKIELETPSANVKNQTENILKQIVEHVKIEVKPEVTEMSIKLKPEHLGKLELNIITEKGIITAQFVAESQQVREIIEANFNQLKQNLQEQGLKVDQLQVSVGQDQSKEGKDGHAQQNPSKSSRRISKIIKNIMNDDESMGQSSDGDPYNIDHQVDYTA